MNLSNFLKRREQQRTWHYANGFGNGDPHTNGEYLCFDFFLKRGISLFLDVGANRGIFSKRALATDPDLPVLAFEPNPQMSEQLATVLAKGNNATPYPLALDDYDDGQVSFFVHPKHHETSSLSPRRLMTHQFQADMHEITVPVRTLDAVLEQTSCCLDHVFLKIDTEGHEAGVMRGAKRTLEKSEKAIILFEYSFAWNEAGQSIVDAFQFLNALGYDFYRVLPYGLEELRFITRDAKHSILQLCCLKRARCIEYQTNQNPLPIRRKYAFMSGWLLIWGV